MSTFNGIISEIPLIRIDFFRLNPSQPPPLACFLSHIHSDHLQGLESLKSPFIYCSAATRRLLLRMEKYPHRMNFAKGILESRKQHYAHLKNLLKAIPLHAPTEIELGANGKIQVTLFDANHCPGAVMFLIQGNGKSILYTGDVRAEPWWVESLVRNPALIPYTLGGKLLDCIYLDTTFATKDDVYRHFPPKANGIHELLRKVDRYPQDTIFYFRAWTLGYEDVWMALSAALGSQIHVDNYQSSLYRLLADSRPEGISVPEAPVLVGFQFGNHFQRGCLSNETNVRIHSCEPGTSCHSQLSKAGGVVWITPIITRSKDGAEVLELGAGGGLGDLNQFPELDVADSVSMQALVELCKKLIKDPKTLFQTLELLSSAQNSRSLRLSLDGLGLDLDAQISLEEFVKLMERREAVDATGSEDPEAEKVQIFSENSLPDTIHFPYSRHSSYDELCHLVSAFTPKDVYACTVDEETWCEDVSMESLFGHLCSGDHFQHDREVRAAVQRRNAYEALENPKKRKRKDDEDTQLFDLSQDMYETARGSVSENPANEEQPGLLKVVYAKGEDSEHHTSHRSANHSHDPSSGEEDGIRKAVSPSNKHINAIRDAFRALNGGKDTVSSAPDLLPEAKGGSNRNPHMSGEFGLENATPGIPDHEFIDLCTSGSIDLGINAGQKDVPKAVISSTTVQDPVRNFYEPAEIQVMKPTRQLHGLGGDSRNPVDCQLPTTNTAIEALHDCDDHSDLENNDIEDFSALSSVVDLESQSKQQSSNSRALASQLDGSYDANDPTGPSPNDKIPVASATLYPIAAAIKHQAATNTPRENARYFAREEAYKAARKCLQTSHSSEWDELIGLRCIGRVGHVEEELEL